MGAKVIDEIQATVTKKFGDEQSSLLDKFERLSFEAHLHNAMRLGRSRSEPGAMWRAEPTAVSAGKNNAPAPAPENEVRRGRRRSSAALRNALMRLFRPIVGLGRSEKKNRVVADPKDPRFWKDFSRSMRF